MRTTPITGPEVWTAEDLRRDHSWVLDLSAAHQAEALSALAGVAERPREAITLEDFPLPTLGPCLDRLIDEIEGGRGVSLVRRAPVAGLSVGEIERLFWGLSLHIGIPEVQDGAGRRLHHVRAEQSFSDAKSGKRAFSESNIRGYQTNLELNFHGDGSDALFFLCVRAAPQGGLSRVVSASAVFNRILSRRPDVARRLQDPFAFDTRGELGPDHPFQLSPIFVEYGGRMNVLYKRGYLELGHRMPGAPRLSPEQIEALDVLDKTLSDPELFYEFRLEPGDIEIANNYNVLHARTQFLDHPDPALGRHMLRIWSTLRRNRRRLPPPFRDSREFAASFRRRLALGDAV